MVSAVNFAVRGIAGSAQQGMVAGENQSNLISVGSGQHISLNLSPGSVVAYQQQGTDLIVQLVDGRSIVLVRRRMIWNIRGDFGAEVIGSSGLGYAALR